MCFQVADAQAEGLREGGREGGGGSMSGHYRCFCCRPLLPPSLPPSLPAFPTSNVFSKFTASYPSWSISGK